MTNICARSARFSRVSTCVLRRRTDPFLAASQHSRLEINNYVHEPLTNWGESVENSLFRNEASTRWSEQQHPRQSPALPLLAMCRKSLLDLLKGNAHGRTICPRGRTLVGSSSRPLSIKQVGHVHVVETSETCPDCWGNSSTDGFSNWFWLRRNNLCITIKLRLPISQILGVGL